MYPSGVKELKSIMHPELISMGIRGWGGGGGRSNQLLTITLKL